ncbi:hypothetical protein, partial [Bacteroides heparinolyticus]|uniref:hypothetical protein n=1 Tax=Prevotella heparinolytica TaxID=28113 RepID=UPI00359F9448
NCLPASSQLPADSESASSPQSIENRNNRQCLNELPYKLSLARAREEKNREEKNRKYLLHIS